MSVVCAFTIVSVKEDREGMSVDVNNARRCYEGAIQSLFYLEQTKEENKKGGETF